MATKKSTQPLRDLTNNTHLPAAKSTAKSPTNCLKLKRNIKAKKPRVFCGQTQAFSQFFRLPEEVYVHISTFLPRWNIYDVGEEEAKRLLDGDTYYKVRCSREAGLRVYYDPQSLVDHVRTKVSELGIVQIQVLREDAGHKEFPMWLLRYVEENERVNKYTLHVSKLQGEEVPRLAEFVARAKKLKSFVVGFDYNVNEVLDDPKSYMENLCRPLFVAIRQCVNLETLVLRDQEYTHTPYEKPHVARFCHEELCDANLSTLIVQDHYLQEQTMTSLLKSLDRKRQKMTLSLEFLACEMENSAGKRLADFLGWDCPLFSLDISNCDMSESTQSLILSKVPFSTSLHFLCIMRTGLTIEALLKIIAAMVFCTCPLVYLNLQVCLLPAGAKYVLPMGIAHSETLSFVNFEGLDLRDGGGLELAEALSKSEGYSLKYLKLENNGFTEKTAYALAKIWRKKTPLKLLSISFHEIKDAGGNALVDVMQSCAETKMLFDIYNEESTTFQNVLYTQAFSIGDIFFNRYDKAVIADARAFLCYDVSMGTSELYE